jgi:hypothetical protein
LEAIDAQQQQRRASMQGRRMSLVEAIPDWPALKHAEKEVEVYKTMLWINVNRLVKQNHSQSYNIHMKTVSVKLLSYTYVALCHCFVWCF